MRPIVTVVLPIYNVEKDLSACLDSLAAQTYPPEKWELLAINDGSTDNSLKIVQSQINRFPNITIVTQTNKGLSAARNRGLKAAKGQFICFVDSDDRLLPDFLDLLVSSAEKNRADMVIGNARINRDGEISDYLDNPVWTSLAKTNRGAASLGLHPKILLFQPSVWRRLYRSDFLRDNQFSFPEGLIFEDMPFHFQTMFKAEWISFVPEPVYEYNDSRRESITNRKDARFFDLFPIFEGIHKFLEQQKGEKWLTYCYVFEFRTLKWAGREIAKNQEKDYHRRMKVSLSYYPFSIKLTGWLLRLKIKLLNRI
ncbi:MAG: glycosyltransferase [Spirochaetales bacterium]|nr:glycosyltransferase [Spirochaetales bacterium]